MPGPRGARMTSPEPVSQTDSHTLSPVEVLGRLHVDPARGLTNEEVRQRRREHGPNLLKESRPKSALSILYGQIKSLIVLLLMAATALSFAFGQWTEGVAVAVVIVINTIIGFATEVRAVRSMEALRRLSVVTAKVRRAGGLQELPSRELVPGDIVVFDAGDIVSADLRLVSASKLRCDESVLTGESIPVGKSVDALPPATALSERINMVFQGTAVTSGSAEGIVVATGMTTELGRIAALSVEATEPTTPLEKRLDYLSRQLVWVTLVLVAAIGGAGIYGGKPALLMIETAIALAVAAVPEGLPMVATLALARGMWRMARRNALIGRLTAVETLGATTVILTDKTGTLTQNRMTVTELALPDGDIVVTSSGFMKNGENVGPGADAFLREALETAVLCNNAVLATEPDHPGDVRIVGDPMEGALLVVGRKAGVERAGLVAAWPEVREEAFDTHLRMMATVHRGETDFLVTVKGAPEAVLANASSVASTDGRRPLDDADRRMWRDKATSLAGKGLRVLALASKTAGSAEGNLYRDLTFLGLVGLHDPPREGAAEAIGTCRRAGIRVVMVTGDHAATAREIAYAVGLTEGGVADTLEGAQLGEISALSEDERRKLLHIPIFARVSPSQKMALISLYQASGAIVAMTGDGVNDAPALRKADIGIAMGRRGSQVAREAADVVLQDDAIGTLVHAIAQGRVIFANIRKFILYLLSCNLSEIMIVGLASLGGLPLPILPLQILFLNLVTDVFPAFALGAGEGEKDVMDAPPRDPTEALLPRRLWAAIAAYSTVITAATLTAFVVAIEFIGIAPKAAVTISFLTLALSQLWHVFNMRDAGTALIRNEITLNKYVWAAVVFCCGLVLAAVYVPGLSSILGLIPPSPAGWALAVGLSLVPLILGQLAKTSPGQRIVIAFGSVLGERKAPTRS